MKERKDCKIVQDLLPNYIDKLTNEESNIFVQEHLKECKECKEILNNMQKDLSIDIKEKEKIKVNYIKKYNKKLRTLKIILLIILTIFLIRTGRNMIIMNDLSNKADEYIASNNYHRQAIKYNGESITIIDSYYKEGKEATFIQEISSNNNFKIKAYNYPNNKYNLYNESNGKKTAQLNLEGNFLKIQIINYLETNTLIEFILKSIMIDMQTVECNGKECYLVKDNLLKQVTYIDKQTGLVVRNTPGIFKNANTGKITDTIHDISYEFRTVTDDIFVEPDIREYELKK